MRTWVGALCVALVMLCAPHATRADDDNQQDVGPVAADATVRILVTNADVDVGAKASVQFYKGGTHTATGMLGNVSAGFAESGQIAKVPEGVYDIRITYEDGNAHKVVWIDKQNIKGEVSRTVELALPMAELRVAVTNGGVDVGRHASIHVYPAGTHTPNGARNTVSVGLGDPGQPIRLMAGTYDVRVSFADSGAEKTIWLDNQTLSGSVERTVEIGLAMAEVRFVITNGGVDTGHKGDIHVYPAGSHATIATTSPTSIGWTTSGQAVRLPAGHYDVRINYEEGEAKKTIWLDDQTLTGVVEKTVEVGVNLAEVRIVVTNGGADVRDKAQVGFFPPGRHDVGNASWSKAGETVRLPAGTYDIQVRFADGSATKEFWLNGQTVAGTFEKTLDAGVAVAEVRYTILDGKTETGNRGEAQFYPHGRHDGPPVDSTRSGVAVRLPAGAYDVHFLYVDGETKREKWLENQQLSGQVVQTVNVGVPLAEIHVVVALNGADTGAKGEAHFYRQGQHNGGSVGWVRSGGVLRIPEGIYNIRVTFADGEVRKNFWLDDQSFTGTVERTLEVSSYPNVAR